MNVRDRLVLLLALLVSTSGQRVDAQPFWAPAGMPGNPYNFQQVWADGDNAIYYAGAPGGSINTNSLMRYADGQWTALGPVNGLLMTVVMYHDTLCVGGGLDYLEQGVNYYNGTAWQPLMPINGSGDVRRLACH